MNLGQIRERVQNELQHAPTTTGWLNDVAQVANDAWMTLASEQRWAFLTVEGSMRLRKDEEDVTFSVASSTGFPMTLRTTPVVRYHDLDALLLVESDTGDSLRRFGRIAGLSNAAWPIRWSQVKKKYDGVGAAGWPDPDLDTTVSVAVSAYLDEQPASTYQGVTYTDGILRHDRYQLPYDCGEIIGIVSRDDKQGELALVNRTAERSLVLNTNQDAPGTPSAWVLDDAVDCGPAPRKTMVATASNTAGGTLTAGTYRHFYCFFGKGTMSGPSNITTTVISGSNDTITLTIIEDEPTSRYWRSKLVFRDDGDGVFRHLATLGPTVTTLVDDVEVPDETFRWDDRMAAPRKAVRFWPRPAADQWVSVSYLKVPNRLVTAQDVPEMPEEYHRILVHLTVAQLAARFDQPRLVQLHTQLANEVRKLMTQREITRYNTNQRSSWSPRRGRRWIPTNPASMS